MTPVLVILGNMTFTENKAVVTEVMAQLYVNKDNLDDFVERMLDTFDSYLIPSEYGFDIEYPVNFIKLPEYPKNFNWGFIEDYLPKYYQRDEVLQSDLMNRFVDDAEENPEQRDIDWMVVDKPDYLTDKEWVFHQMTELEIRLFDEAAEAR